MSLQGAVEGSDSRKSRLKDLRALLRSMVTFDRTGSLKDRVLTASLMLVGAFVLTTLAVVLPYGGFLCVAFTTAIVAMSVFEVVRLFARDSDTLHYRPMAGTVMFLILAVPGLVAAVSSVSSIAQGSVWWQAMYGSQVVSATALMLALALEGRVQIEEATRFTERYVFSFLIVGMCAPTLIIISGLPRGVYILWWIASCAALNDIAAYFVGRSCGSHRMAPALSPKKSFEGSIAGLVAGTGTGVLLWELCMGKPESVWKTMLVSLLVVVAAQSADLAKSYLKRTRGVKDTGAIFPGHGGFLDRFDAMIGAAPVVLVALCLFGII